MKVTVGKNVFLLEPGDSIYFNPCPGQAARRNDQILTVINE